MSHVDSMKAVKSSASAIGISWGFFCGVYLEFLCPSDGDLLLITEPALLTRYTWLSQLLPNRDFISIYCAALLITVPKVARDMKIITSSVTLVPITILSRLPGWAKVKSLQTRCAFTNQNLVFIQTMVSMFLKWIYFNIHLMSQKWVFNILLIATTANEEEKIKEVWKCLICCKKRTRKPSKTNQRIIFQMNTRNSKHLNFMEVLCACTIKTVPESLCVAVKFSELLSDARALNESQHRVTHTQRKPAGAQNFKLNPGPTLETPWLALVKWKPVSLRSSLPWREQKDENEKQ